MPDPPRSSRPAPIWPSPVAGSFLDHQPKPEGVHAGDRRGRTRARRPGTHEYQKLILPSELAAHCRAAGLDLRHTRGMEHNHGPALLAQRRTHQRQLHVRDPKPEARTGRTEAVLFDLDGTPIDSALTRAPRRPAPSAACSRRLNATAGMAVLARHAGGLRHHAGAPSFRTRSSSSSTNRGCCSPQVFEGWPNSWRRCASGCEGVVTNKSERFTRRFPPRWRCSRARGRSSAVTPFPTPPHRSRCSKPPAGWGVARCMYVGTTNVTCWPVGPPACTVAAIYGYMGEQAEVARWDADAASHRPWAEVTKQA